MEGEGKMGNEDEVGFGKPPVHSRFRKGCSGNSTGRPKGTKNLRTDLTEVLQERITVTEGDRKVRMSKQRAIVMTLVAKTLKGDSRITTTLLNTMFRALGFADTGENAEPQLDAKEQDIMAGLEARFQRKAESSTKPEVLPDNSRSQS